MAEDKDALNPNAVADALKDTISKTVSEALAGAVKTQQEEAARLAAEQEAERRRAATAPKPGDDPLRDTLDPYLKPIANQAVFAGQAAKDAVVFYQKNPKAAKYADEIEQRFDRLAQNGTPFSRADIYNHMRGEKFDEFVKEDQEEQRLAAERAAREAAMLGPGSRLPGSAEIKDAHEASDEELADALKNVSF